MCLRDMKYIGFKHQRENKQNSDKCAYLLESSETNITIWRQESSKIAIFRMCYGENSTVKYFETLADNVFRHKYSMMQIKKIE